MRTTQAERGSEKELTGKERHIDLETGNCDYSGNIGIVWKNKYRKSLITFYLRQIETERDIGL